MAALWLNPLAALIRNRLQHRFEFLEHFAVGEANNVIAFGGKPLRPGGIVDDLSGFGVRVAVDFDAEFGFGAIEVDDKVTDDMLTANFEPVYLAVAQT